MLKGLLARRPRRRLLDGAQRGHASAPRAAGAGRRGRRSCRPTPTGSSTLDGGSRRRCAPAPTAAVVCQHASNVTGAIQPIADLADIAHENGALLLVDGAQGAGHLPVDLAALDVDAYAISGHKGLLGPQGVGLLYLRAGSRRATSSWRAAPVAARARTPGSRPSVPTATRRARRTRPGSPASAPPSGFCSSTARSGAPRSSGVPRASSEGLLRHRRSDASSVPARTSRASPSSPSSPIAWTRTGSPSLLDRRYGIAVRSGLHCAPWAHRTLGTLRTGAVRFGVGHGNTDADIDAALAAMREVLS